jgi:hypothetical protein
MAAGDVTVTIFSMPVTAADIDTAVTAQRVTANDKWLMTSAEDQIFLVHIEEA